MSGGERLYSFRIRVNGDRGLDPAVLVEWQGANLCDVRFVRKKSSVVGKSTEAPTFTAEFHELGSPLEPGVVEPFCLWDM
jgi:hypothetical protein